MFTKESLMDIINALDESIEDLIPIWNSLDELDTMIPKEECDFINLVVNTFLLSRKKAQELLFMKYQTVILNNWES